MEMGTMLMYVLSLTLKLKYLLKFVMFLTRSKLSEGLSSYPQNNFPQQPENTKCENLRIFLPLRFYVKSIWANFEVLTMGVCNYVRSVLILIFVALKATVWKYDDFSITQILREINFENS